jgi:cytoskeletal protein CcmA (bactofilin family)
MFGSSKNDAAKAAAAANTPNTGNSFNSLVNGTHIEGNVHSEKDIRVDGRIKGNLHCDAKVVIGPTGAIEGDIRCVNAVIEGSFQGKLYVQELLNVRETADIRGDVHTGKLIVQSGAVFNVKCSMGHEGTEKPAKASAPAHAQAE